MLLYALVAAAIAVVVFLIAGKAALRALRVFVRSFWPHS
jgi:hypothetical protein